MKLRLLTIASLLLATTTMAQAAWTSQDLVEKYRAEGYTRVEIDISSTYAKVEAIKGTEKLEVIYDLVTGTILKTERERVDGDDSTTPGTFIRDREDRYFDEDDFDDDRHGDDDDANHHDGSDDSGHHGGDDDHDDDRDDDSGHHGGDDDHDDDDRDDDSGHHGGDRDDDDRDDRGRH